MKVIVDAQLPRKLCQILDHYGVKSTYVGELPNRDVTINQKNKVI